MRSYDAVIFTAAEQARPFFRAGVFRPGLPVHEVPEASTHFSPGDPEAARAAAGVHGRPCLAGVGRLDRNKDPLTVLDGFAAAAPELPDPHLWCLYRSEELLEAVETRIEAEPALRHRVHLLGSRPHDAVETLLQGADALLQGSHREGSGFAVIEALACGAIPVVTDIAPFRRLAGDRGVFWTAGDAASLADALRRLPGRVSTAERDATRGHFDRHLSWDAVGERMAEVYRAVGRERGRPSTPR